MYILLCYNQRMTPEQVQREERRVLEHDATVALERLRAARNVQDIEAEMQAEDDLNASLDAYNDLRRAIGRIAL